MATETNSLSTALRVLGHTLHVRRGWPGKGRTITFETRDSSGFLRAGKIDDSGEVTLTPYGMDNKLPGLANALEKGTSTGELLVHRYGKRAVVKHEKAITKFLRPGKAQNVAAVSTAIRAACRQIGLGAAQVSEVSDGCVTFSLLPGRSLHEMGDSGRDGWDAFFKFWPQWQGLEVPGLPTFSAADEAATLRTWVAHAVNHGVAHADELVRAAEKVCGALQGGVGKSGRVLVHRDLHDKQLLWDGRTLSVLDLDTAAYGEAELDAGNLLAHVRLRKLQGLIGAETADALSAGITALAPGPRLSAYEDSAALRLACVYAFRPAATEWWPEWTATTLETIALR